MDFYKRALALREETISHRRWLHSNAEVGLHMPKGQAYVMDQLRGYGLDPHPCGHGVTAELGPGRGADNPAPSGYGCTAHAGGKR